MTSSLQQKTTKIYSQYGLVVSKFELEPESVEYYACRFELNGFRIISRQAKVTPKKSGQFVTFWKRSNIGPIEPLHESDHLDYYVVHVRTENEMGQFIFPKTMLIKKGILSTDKKEGKRAFRVYPPWDTVSSKQAERTQKWQMEFYYAASESKRIASQFKVD